MTHPTEATTAIAPVVVKIPAAMTMLSTSRSGIYRLLDAGELTAIKVAPGQNGSRKILVQSIQDYIARKLASSQSAQAA